MRTPWPLLATVLLAGCTDRATQPPLTRPAPVTSAPAAPAPSPVPTAQALRLTGDGIETPQGRLAFGEPFEQVQPVLRTTLGEPTRDTGVVDSQRAYGVCPGSRLRGLEFAGGALTVVFGDVIGPGLTMYQWTLRSEGRPEDVPRASALVGDVTTFDFGVGTTLVALRAGTAGSELTVFEPESEVFPARFRLADQSAGFDGGLTGTSPQDRVSGVVAGERCGE